MAEVSELYEWLDAQSAAGALDSEGSFTMKHDEAWSKLTAFQLPVEEGWALKLVQAMSACEGARMNVSQMANETVFLVSQTNGWTREKVEDALFSLDPHSATAISHLSLAVRILVQLKERPFSVRYDDGEKVVWTGERFVPLSESAPPVFELRVGHFTFEQNRRMGRGAHGAKVSANIAAALRRHCHLAPEKIFIDGYLITSGENDEDLGSPNSGRPLALLQVWEKYELPSFLLARTNRAPTANLGRHKAYIDTRLAGDLKGTDLCYAAGLLSVFLDGQGRLQERGSRILWLNDGVIVHRERLDLPARPLAVGVIISSEGLETDISGLIPRQNEEYFRRRHLGLKAVWQHLEKMVRQLGREGITTKPSAGLPSAFGGAGLLFSLKAPLVGAALFGLAGITYLMNSSAVEEVDKALDAALHELVADLDSLVAREEV